MIIQKHWNILTVGDGDLSFSRALLHHISAEQLTATVFDSRAVLNEKYADEHALALEQAGSQVIFDFDVTRPDSWPQDSDVLPLQSFDLVIFQFPLVPAFSSHDDFLNQCDGISVNTVNRRLLRLFLIHCEQYFLAEQGAQLCYITSKDVKPYCEWNIEYAICQQTKLHYLGSLDFNLDHFPGYRIRNVNRDKFVRDRVSTTFIWSPNKEAVLTLPSGEIATLQQPDFYQPGLHQTVAEEYCQLCKAGPFTTVQQREGHLLSRKHKLMMLYEQQWQALLANEGCREGESEGESKQ